MYGCGRALRNLWSQSGTKCSKSHLSDFGVLQGCVHFAWRGLFYKQTSRVRAYSRTSWRGEHKPSQTKKDNVTGTTSWVLEVRRKQPHSNFQKPRRNGRIALVWKRMKRLRPSEILIPNRNFMVASLISFSCYDKVVLHSLRKFSYSKLI